MNRAEFETLRDLPEKKIGGRIEFVQRRQTSPLWTAENIQIENTSGSELRLTIQLNPEVGSTSFNVDIAGVGPICRLDVDGPAHRPAGRSHKHSLQTPRCADQNLPKVIDRPDLSGKPPAELFAIFCQMASITFEGELVLPENV